MRRCKKPHNLICAGNGGCDHCTYPRAAHALSISADTEALRRGFMSINEIRAAEKVNDPRTTRRAYVLAPRTPRLVVLLAVLAVLLAVTFLMPFKAYGL